MRWGLAILLFATVFAPWFATAAEQQPAPSAAEIADAQRRVRDAFKEELSQRATPEARLAAAYKLLKDGLATEGDGAVQFVMLGEAADLAAQAGDADLALRANCETAARFKGQSAPAMWVETLRAVGKVPVARGAAGEKKAEALGRLCLVLAEAAAAQDDVASADELLKMAARLAAKSPPLAAAAAEANKTLREFKAELQKSKAALARLTAAPGDAASNGTLGRFYCLWKGQWRDGLLMLSKGTDPLLKDLAARDLKSPEGEAARALADAYWLLSEKHAGTARANLRGRSARWYAAALPTLKGLEKVTAEKRMVSAASAGPALAVSEAVSLGDASYRRYDLPVSWHLAKGICEQLRGRLVCIKSAEAQATVEKLLNHQNIWIGASDEAAEGQWKWVDESPLSYDRWRRGRPDNADRKEHWAILAGADDDEHWEDVPYEPSRYGFICEWPRGADDK